MVSNFSKSSQAWKDRLKNWGYTCTFVVFLNIYYTILHIINVSTWGVMRVGLFSEVNLFSCVSPSVMYIPRDLSHR